MDDYGVTQAQPAIPPEICGVWQSKSLANPPETELKIYELEAKDSSILAVSDTIQVRVEKDSAYVLRSGKEQEFRLIDTMLKDGD